MNDTIKNEFNKHINLVNLLHNLTDAVAFSAQLCIDCLKNGGKIIFTKTFTSCRTLGCCQRNCSRYM